MKKTIEEVGLEVEILIDKYIVDRETAGKFKDLYQELEIAAIRRGKILGLLRIGVTVKGELRELDNPLQEEDK